MKRQQAEMIAEGLGAGAEAYETGTGFWVVGKQTADGYVVIGPEGVCQYESKDAFLDGDGPEEAIAL